MDERATLTLALVIGVPLGTFGMAREIPAQVVSPAVGLEATRPWASSELLRRPARLVVERVPLGRAIAELQEGSGVPLFYSPTLLPIQRIVSCACWSATVGEALEILLRETSLEVSVIAGTVVVRESPATPPPWLKLEPAPALRGVPGDGASALLRAPRLSPSVRGAVGGRVSIAFSDQPLAGAQVEVVGTSIGGLTNADGAFLLPGVPVGRVTVRVQHIGYGTAERIVEVAPARTAGSTFRLAERVIDLEELVVTGVGVTERRGRFGTSTETVALSDLEESPAASLTRALQGRVPGILAVGGALTGSAAPIRLRGSASISQRNSPVVYVDGIRIDAGVQRSSSMFSSRLDDLNPGDIERIEVIKGAAAATLFGTEASSGVIQLFTKRGRDGEPRYSFTMEQGLTRIPLDAFPDNVGYDAENHRLARNNPAADFMRTGHRQTYGASVSGGTPTATWFASGRVHGETGALPTNEVHNLSVRANLDLQHSPKLRTDLGVHFSRNRLRAPHPSWGLVGEFTLANPLLADERRPYGEGFYTVASALEFQNWVTAERGTLSGRASYQWTPTLTTSLGMGYDRIVEIAEVGVEAGSSVLRNPDGLRELANEGRHSATLDFTTRWERSLGASVGSALWVGAQYFEEARQRSNVSVTNFPAPGLRTLDGGSTVTAIGEVQEEVVNAGVFGQAQIGFRDRLFVTGGVRVDGNSAFGQDLGLQVYPKAGLSWVVVDPASSGKRPSWLDLLRLRAAFGTSGLQPGAFDATRTYRPATALGNVPVIVPGNVGNPSLKPERSSEYEIGLDASFWGDRVGLDATYFRQRTSDAILPRQGPASSGFLEPQLQNLGELTSQGLEVTTRLSMIRQDGIAWDLRTSVSTLDQRVRSLGGVAEFYLPIAGGVNRWMIREGAQPGAWIGEVIDPEDPYTLRVAPSELTRLEQITPNTLEGDGGADSLVYGGNSVPTLMFDVENELRLGRSLTLRALVAGATGFVIFNESDLIRTNTRTTEMTAGFQMELADPATPTERRLEIADAYARRHPAVASNWIDEGDYVRLSEVGVRYRVPAELGDRVGLSDVSIGLAATNVFLWTRYPGLMEPGDTSMARASDTGLNFMGSIDFFDPPRSRGLLLTLRASR